jgi:peptide/nickel transport system permease protein
MRLDPRIAPETVAALQSRYGVMSPLPVRYARWLAGALCGDLGYSFAYGIPAAPLVWTRALNTLQLTATAMAFAWLLAIPLGAWSAWRRGRWDDRLASTGLAALMAVPELLLALALLMLAVRTGWFPTGGHLFLPACALALGMLPVLARHTRAAVAEALAMPFVRAARAHGIPPARLLFRHALPAAINPVITLFGFSLGGLLSGSLAVEAVLSWPGLGTLLLEAILARDLYIVIAGVMLSTVMLAAGNLVADILLYAADPRIRRPEAS